MHKATLCRLPVALENPATINMDKPGEYHFPSGLQIIIPVTVGQTIINQAIG